MQNQVQQAEDSNKFIVLSAPGSLSVANLAPPNPLTVYSTTEEIVRICPNGDVLWRGRLVESDDDFKKAMLDMADTMKNLYRKGTL